MAMAGNNIHLVYLETWSKPMFLPTQVMIVHRLFEMVLTIIWYCIISYYDMTPFANTIIVFANEVMSRCKRCADCADCVDEVSKCAKHSNLFKLACSFSGKMEPLVEKLREGIQYVGQTIRVFTECKRCTQK